MTQTDALSMFILGLLGTGHCLGMCGPLVLAFPAATGRFSSHLSYHLGRVATYLLMGTALGAAGWLTTLVTTRNAADPAVWVVRIQVTFSVIAALFLLLYGMSRLDLLSVPRWLNVSLPLGMPGSRAVLRAAVDRKTRWNLFLLGALLGFLPCGLSFAAFARALATRSPYDGVTLVAAFAAGTLPGLLLLGTGVSRLSAKYRPYLNGVSGMLMIGMGAVLLVDAVKVLVRGLAV